MYAYVCIISLAIKPYLSIYLSTSAGAGPGGTGPQAILAGTKQIYTSAGAGPGGTGP